MLKWKSDFLPKKGATPVLLLLPLKRLICLFETRVIERQVSVYERIDNTDLVTVFTEKPLKYFPGTSVGQSCFLRSLYYV